MSRSLDGTLLCLLPLSRRADGSQLSASLLDHKVLIALRGCLGTLGPIDWGGQGVEEDSAGFARDIRSHKPCRLGLGKHRAFGYFVDVLYPRVFRLRLRSNALQALLAHVANAIGNPFNDRLGADRVVTKCGVDGNEEVWEARALQPQVVARSIGPLVLDRLATFATNIDPGQRSCHSIKPRGIDDDVECILLLSGLDAIGSDALNRGVVPVVKNFSKPLCLNPRITLNSVTYLVRNR